MPNVLGTTESPELNEISGLVAGSQEGVFFTHNDSGDSARFFAIGATGKTLGEYRLAEAVAIDIEDIAMGPCPSGHCVFLGDFGDNRHHRTQYSIFRIPEPTQPALTQDVAFERFDFTYPHEAHPNVEAMVVDPDSGLPYLVTKVGPGEVAEVFRFPGPLMNKTSVELVKVTDLKNLGAHAYWVTGADFHPCGSRLLLRTYTELLLFRGQDGTSFESLFEAPVSSIPVASEAQGEAVAFRRDGLGYVTVSEGEHPALNESRCR